MRQRAVRALFLGALLIAVSAGMLVVALAIVVVRTNDSDGRSETEPYLRQIDSIKDEYAERIMPLNHSFDPRLGQRAAIMNDFLGLLSALKPTRELVHAHEKLKSAVSRYRDIDLELTRRAQDVDYGPDMVQLINEVLSGSEAVSAANGERDSCLEMQEVANRYEIPIDLMCSEDANNAKGVNICLNLDETPDENGNIRPHTNCDASIAPIEDACSSDVGPDVPLVSNRDRPDSPTEMIPASDFLAVDARGHDRARLCVSLYGDYEEDDNLVLYTFDGIGWRNLGGLQLRSGGTSAEIQLDRLPENLAIFKPRKAVP